MEFIQTLNIPPPQIQNASFFEDVNSSCILTSTETSKQAVVYFGVYNRLAWETTDAPEELEDAVTWGTKTLPGAGPFYFANHEDGNPTLGHLNIPPPPPYDPTYVSVDYIYEVVDNTITLIYYLGNSLRIAVPSIDEHDIPVTRIASTCFCLNSQIEAVKIPEGVTIIE